MTLHTNTREETIELGSILGKYLKPGDIIAMQGTLAAGKTTITKGIAQSLGVEETVTSPTFTLISEYEGRLPLYHMDVYRLDSTEDFINLGTEDMLYGKGVSIIEWSEKIMEELPKKTIILKLTAQDDGSRHIELTNFEDEKRAGFSDEAAKFIVK
ncbi:MAG: tRNA (adenosine(37)-N6)-threonylcarbamoyltransferase complex ATPase subunit type 1 TsaE [Treponemataceae bacterium]|nr:tRNA (adenosine(37)-N6)-threonylcarbamoyltransferase complex ATPase subunit type 1 TsaE [Treponemataceae bacterium]